MKLTVTANDRTYSIQLPWWLVLAALFSAVLWQPAAAWASTTFSDVPSSHTFHDDIEWMADTGVTKGCNPPTNDEYCPDDFVTREQMAAFMHRFADTQVATLEAEVATLQTKVTTLESENDDLQSLLAGVTRNGDRLLFSGMNLQVVNGTGTTDGTPNGLGNIIIGYDPPRTVETSDKSGSHYLVVGDEHNYTSYGGILAGWRNTASGTWASVSGGAASTATNSYASVSGGVGNDATGYGASVSGGSSNTASGTSASVSGGYNNDATGNGGSVSGGNTNTASGFSSSILGGHTKAVSLNYACHPSCA